MRYVIQSVKFHKQQLKSFNLFGGTTEDEVKMHREAIIKGQSKLHEAHIKAILKLKLATQITSDKFSKATLDGLKA